MYIFVIIISINKIFYINFDLLAHPEVYFFYTNNFTLENRHAVKNHYFDLSFIIIITCTHLWYTINTIFSFLDLRSF